MDHLGRCLKAKDRAFGKRTPEKHLEALLVLLGESKLSDYPSRLVQSSGCAELQLDTEQGPSYTLSHTCLTSVTCTAILTAQPSNMAMCEGQQVAFRDPKIVIARMHSGGTRSLLAWIRGHTRPHTDRLVSHSARRRDRSWVRLGKSYARVRPLHL